MRGFRFIRFLVIGFLFFALIGGASNMLYRSGFSQGFVAGQTAATTDGVVGEVISQSFNGRSAGFPLAALCLNALFLFLAFGFVMKLIGLAKWRRYGRGEDWGKHGPWRRHRSHWGRRRHGGWCEGSKEEGYSDHGDENEPPKAGLDYV